MGPMISIRLTAMEQQEQRMHTSAGIVCKIYECAHETRE